jgi:hypothetical protein
MAKIENGSITVSDSTPSVKIDEDEFLFEEPPTLENSQSLFHRADLAVYPTKAAAKADWDRLEKELDLSELTPMYDEVGGGVRISTGPFASLGDVKSACADIKPAAGACAPSAPETVLQ